MTPQNPDKTQDDGERSGVKIKRLRTTILILVALLLGYPAYKAGVFAWAGRRPISVEVILSEPM